MIVSFTVPGKARGKQRPRTAVIGGHAHIYTPAQTRAEERTVRAIAYEAMKGRAPTACPVSVSITEYREVPKSWSAAKRKRALADTILPTTKPDINNVVSLIYDACRSVVYRDDSQVVRQIADKFYSDSPRVEVTITEMRGERA